MAAWFPRLLIAGMLVAAGRPVFADGPSFADLLARAKAQSAAGHRWAPVGDNMTETVSALMELISSATPDQLVELSDLLEQDAKGVPRLTAEPDRVAEQPGKAEVAPESDRAIERPAVPAKKFELDRSEERPAVAAATAEPDQAVKKSAAPTTRFKLDSAVRGPTGQAATSPGADRPADRLSAPVATLAPSIPLERPAIRLQLPKATSEPDRAVTQPASPPAPAAPDRGAMRPGVQAMAKEPNQGVAKLLAPVARPPSPRATDLLTRGQEAEQLGDVSGARRFYLSAVQLGSAAAARSLGRLYDPVILKQTALGGIDPDVGQARHWYELSIAMGDADALPLLEALASR